MKYTELKSNQRKEMDSFEGIFLPLENPNLNREWQKLI
jgi:hypothetical protein